MSVVVVGGDYLDQLSSRLENQGFEVIKHISGRKTRDAALPDKTEALILLTDYVNHNVATALKNEAKKRGIKTVFARHSWAHLSKELSMLKN